VSSAQAFRSISVSSDRRRFDRFDLVRLSMVWLLAAVVASCWRATEPVEHGIWLVAYLALVGFAAQLLIACGQAQLRCLAGLSAVKESTRRAEVAMWNLGVVFVPLGVLLETRLAVLLGTLTLLAALTSFLCSVRAALDKSEVGSLGRAYLALLTFMAASTVTGLALAWDTPWLGIT
jgi:hypothetical protein